MKADQQTMTKDLPFKTKQSLVAQSIFKWQRFEEQVTRGHNIVADGWVGASNLHHTNKKYEKR